MGIVTIYGSYRKFRSHHYGHEKRALHLAYQWFYRLRIHGNVWVVLSVRGISPYASEFFLG